MPKVNFNFYSDPSTLVDSLEYEISLSELVLAGMIVGRPSWAAVMQHGRWSVIECIWRSAMIVSNLAINPRTAPSGDCFVPSSAFSFLDPSEKGAATFFIAGAFTRIIAEKAGIPALYHLDTVGMYAGYLPTLPRIASVIGSKRRPDFIGPNASGTYGVFESKGRTNFSSQQLRLSAKEQTQMISTIDGLSPFCRIACITAFGASRGDVINVDIVDPSDAVVGAFEVNTANTDAKEPFRFAHAAISNGKEEIKELNGRKYVVSKIEEADLEFGLDEDLFNAVGSASDVEMRNLVKDMAGKGDFVFPDTIQLGLSRASHHSTSFSMDGHYIRLGAAWESLLEKISG